MFQLIPIPRGKGKLSPQLPLPFLGQFLVVSLVVLLFILYVSGLLMR
jgi:hypothetical protein